MTTMAAATPKPASDADGKVAEAGEEEKPASVRAAEAIAEAEMAAAEQAKALAAAQALALMPEGLPSELTSKLRAIETEADDAARIAGAKTESRLAIHIAAVVSKAAATVDAAALHADVNALSSALGAEVLSPITFRMTAMRS